MTPFITPNRFGVNMQQKGIGICSVWMEGLNYCLKLMNNKKLEEVNFSIDGQEYNLTYKNEFFQLRKNGGGYKSEFYTLGIKDHHIVADHLVEYVKELEE